MLKHHNGLNCALQRKSLVWSCVFSLWLLQRAEYHFVGLRDPFSLMITLLSFLSDDVRNPTDASEGNVNFV